MRRATLHIIGADSRSRAEEARTDFVPGPQHEGIVVAAADGEPGATRELIQLLGASGLWLPVVMSAPKRALKQVVAAFKAGALDYLCVLLEMAASPGASPSFSPKRTSMRRDAAARSKPSKRISLLSRREPEVLELLDAGYSNKEIGRYLQISPRRVKSTAAT